MDDVQRIGLSRNPLQDINKERHRLNEVGEYEVKRNLIVNYLPQNLTERGLFNIFVPFGPIESVKVMRDSKSGYSYGFGFVNFDSEVSASKAREFLNGFQVGNKRLKVSVARPPSEEIKGTNLFITNLPKNTTTNDIYEWFGRYGKIVQHNILVDKVTNEPRGVGFVRFEKRDEANEALKGLHGFNPSGATNPIRVKIAEEHGKQKAAYLAGFKAGIHQQQSSFR